MNKKSVPNPSEPKRDSIKDLVGNLATQIGIVIRGEIALAVQSVRERITDLRSGLIMIAAAFFIGFVACLSLSTAIVMKLSQVMSLFAAASLYGGILIVAGSVLAFFGYKKINPSKD